jgi:methyl-accepting chemotaxis protein
MNPRQLGAPLALVLLGIVGNLIAQQYPSATSNLFFAIGIVAAGAVLVLSGPQKGPSLGPLLEAIQSAARGKKPSLPEGATGQLAEVYDELGRLAKRNGELSDEVKQLESSLASLPKGGSVDLDPLVDALKAAAKGKRSRLPDDAPPEMAEVYDELGKLVRKSAEQAEEVEQLQAALASQPKGGSVDLDPLVEALKAATKGKRPRLPDDASPEMSEVYDELGKLVRRSTELAEEVVRLEQAGAGKPPIDVESIIDAAGRLSLGERVRVPAGVPGDVARLYAELIGLGERVTEAEQREKARRNELAQAAGAIEDAFPRMTDGVQSVLMATEQATGHIREMTTALSNISQSIETLASNAEESSSSILEMTATNDETAENIGELAASVRETVSSIEEMAYSIREVAKNVDALSLTAEETSSSMNQMDVSIDQVQSNANETARLSEEVATDAEKGAEAILKTIGEIYRIKESSQEAVAVISNLGFRIEAIGQILQVIDDVAEQTNLLALNAAIIAAQAGEHGKGFAVVADEIKDLAERAGGSTKEIAELIKTIQAESKNAIAAVERGAHNVDRGVEVSNEAERALKKILESSQKSTNMVRAIARATVEQAKGSKQVTDAIGRIAETVQQIAAATAEQARGSELIMKSAEKMRTITQHVERSSQEQARGGRQITGAIEQISNMVNSLNGAQKTQMRGGEQLLDAARRIDEAARGQEQAVRQLVNASERLRRVVA